MLGVVEPLRQNDPNKTRLYIFLCLERSDADLIAQALEQNPFVTSISINLDFEGRGQRVDWNSLLRVIATRAILEKVKVLASRWGGPRNTPAALIHSILQAIQLNTAIRNVELEWLRLPIDISTTVDMPSITSLSICGCDMEAAEREQGSRSLAVALQRNKYIQSLKISKMEDIFTIPILESLQSNTSVKAFTFSPLQNFSDAAAHALHQLLESTTLIQKFELGQATFIEMQFRPIAQAITSSECISELKLSGCRFGDDESCIAQLQSILQNKRNLSALCLYQCEYGPYQFMGNIFSSSLIPSTFLGPGSSLRCFELYCEELEQTIPVTQFKNLLQAIEKSNLERFQIGSIRTPHHLQALAQSIPSMKLEELEVAVIEEQEFDRETTKQDLLHGVKNNFSLRAVKFESRIGEFDWFGSAEDKQTLAFCANRNKRLDQWVNNPKTVERKVWPEALNLAESAGPNALFRGLRTVLESDYGSVPGGRKRKRPQYYAPS